MTNPDIFGGNVPEPRLLAPVQEEVDLSNTKKLEFRWSPHEGSLVDRSYYDFRLYKGYDMVASALILKKRLARNIYQVNLNTDLFEKNQVYIWSLRQVYSSGKSKPSHSSFRIIKK